MSRSSRPAPPPSRRRPGARSSAGKLFVALAGVALVAAAVALLLPRANKQSAANETKNAPLQLSLPPTNASSNAQVSLAPNPADISSLPASNVIALTMADATMSTDDRVSFFVNQGNTYLTAQRPDDALAVFDAALTQKPDDEDLHFNRGIALMRLGRVDDARQAYESALRLFPDYAEAHNNLGNLLANQGNLADAAQHFQAAIKAAPENASAHNNLGSVLARQKRYSEALDHFLLATRYQTNYVEAHFNVGGAYLELGRLDEAAAKFIEILQAHPDFRPAQLGLERVRRKRQ